MKTLTIRNVEEIQSELEWLQEYYNEKTAAGAIRAAVKNHQSICSVNASNLRSYHDLKTKYESLVRLVDDYLENVKYNEIKRERIHEHLNRQ